MGEPYVLKIDMPLSVGSQPKADETTRKLYEDARPSIVQTSTESGHGTGFAVGSNRFVTDAHCVLGGKDIKIIGTDGTKYKARIVDVDDINDLALLEIVSNKIINFKPMPLGKNEDMKADDKLFAVGHPLGVRDVYISPGYFRENITQKQFWNHANWPEMGDPDTFKLTPKEAADFSDFQNRSLISARVHIEHGNSGGPLLNESGKVVGVCDLGVNDKFSSDTYYTPVDKVNAMLERNAPKFQFREEWQAGLPTDLKNAIIQPTERTFAAVAVGYGCYSLRKMKGKSEAAGVLGGVMLFDDASNLYYSDHVRDKTKYGTATAGDAFMLAGGTLSVLNRNKVSEKLLGKVGPYGKYVATGGLAVRVGAEFIPNRLTSYDVGRTDGEYRAPFQVDLTNLTKKSKAELEAEKAVAGKVANPQDMPKPNEKPAAK